MAPFRSDAPVDRISKTMLCCVNHPVVRRLKLLVLTNQH